MREFAQRIERYFGDNAGRAIVSIDDRNPRHRFRNNKQYALIDGEQVFFFDGFPVPDRNGNNFEGIVTIIHETLHSMSPIKERERLLHYDQLRRGSPEWAKYEADLDNQAKNIAKSLGLIPKDYPPTDWHKYLGR